ncbi:MAG: hypothetical protein V1858_02220 [Candidatus Gottesmanbacteria bacterium]
MKKILILIIIFVMFVSQTNIAIAAFPSASYEIIEPSGGRGTSSSMTNLPKLVSDDKYLYSLVVIGDQTLWDQNQLGLRIQRKQINTTENFITIWEKPNGVFLVNGGIVLDKNGRLHIFYVNNVNALGQLAHEIANTPQSYPVTFSPDKLLPLNNTCKNCRLGLTYDYSTDSIFIVFDQLINNYPEWAYSYIAVYKNNSWSTPEIILKMYYEYLTVDESVVFGYFYPKIIVFNDQLHVFYVGHPYGSIKFNGIPTQIKWFKNLTHYYRNLSGGSWASEIIRDTQKSLDEIIANPSLQNIERNFFDDVFVTGDNQLAVVGTYVNCPNQIGGSYSCNLQDSIRQTIEYLNPTGIGNWNNLVLYQYNYKVCVQKTSDGVYHLLKPGFNDELEYAQSIDGKSWTDRPISQKPNFTLQGGHGCLEENGRSLNEAYAQVDGYTPSQVTTNKSSHTVILTKIDLSKDITDFRKILSTFTSIFDYNQLVVNFGSR